MRRAIDQVFAPGNGRGVRGGFEGKPGPVVGFVPGGLDVDIYAQHGQYNNGKDGKKDFFEHKQVF